MSGVNNGCPLILSFVSGKGGVGKTMLAVAAANELAQVCPTLVLDLDLFNRGLSGMFIRSTIEKPIAPPSFLSSANGREWFAAEIANNLYTVSFPDVEHLELGKHAPEHISDLAIDLQNWIVEIATQLNCEAVVLDCHGGPDVLSFASTKIANKTLLVSEPDRVTMFGTLHFLRRLDQLDICQSNVHLVFNKVVDSVGSTFLWRVYNRTLRVDYFADKPLLAAFPLELYLTKSFELNPLVSEDYPQSMLARKTQVMLFDLLHEEKNNFISRRARSVPRLMKNFRRKFFGRPPKLLSLDFLAAIGFVLLLVSSGLSLLRTDYRRELLNLGWNVWGWRWRKDADQNRNLELVESLKAKYKLIEEVVEYWDMLIMVWAVFAAAAVVLSWTRYLDRQATLFSHNRRYFSSGLHLLVTICLWGFVVYFLSTLFGDVLREYKSEKSGFENAGVVLIVILSAIGIVVTIWLGQAYRAYRDIRYSNRVFVGSARGIFAGAVLCATLVLIVSNLAMQ